jgi:phage-related protein
MSEEYYYNRVSNFSGISEIDLTGKKPDYGSTVSFSAKNLSLDIHDNHLYVIPYGINSLEAEFQLLYKTTESGAAQICSTLENTSGITSVSFSVDGDIYKNSFGYCDGYAINHKSSEDYEVAASIKVTEAPNLMNWSGTNFLNYDMEDWSGATSYETFDIVYTGVNENKLNNFYYCTGDHVSDAENSPTGINSAWGGGTGNSFFWCPDAGLQNEVSFDTVKFGERFVKRQIIKKNTALVPITYNFTDLSTKEAFSLLHFLETKGGYRRFNHLIPSVYNRPKVYICPQWQHTFKSFNAHDIQISLIEDPLGVIYEDD